MRHARIDPALFAAHRDRLRGLLPPGAVAILHAADLMPTSADGTMPLHPAPDLFHLTGIEQPESLLVIAPDAVDPLQREMLFIRRPSDELATWEGHTLSQDEARAISGVAQVKWTADAPAILHRLLCQAGPVFLNANEHERATTPIEPRDLRLARELMHRYPLHRYERLAPLMRRLRAVKSPQEIDLLRRSIAITADGFRRVAAMLRPGVMEYEIEAELLHEFTRQRATMAYQPIIASGANACVLHYTANDAACRDGDLVLLDVGARHANYNADLTRVLPVSGRFTPRQRSVYEAVLRVMRDAIRRATPGTLQRDWHRAAQVQMAEELVGLGLITPAEAAADSAESPACRKYFMHGLGHPLGLDVHDIAPLEGRFEPGWVITVEPGIYIREEGIGVRLENDVLVTDSGPVDLMADIPVEPDAIEALLACRSR
jgi:Xaa-Pro aminopeptidase